VPGHVTCLVRSWPRLSQTFILNELLALERLGLELTVVSLTRSREPTRQPHAAVVRAPVRYLDEPRWYEPLARVADHVTVALRAPRRYASALLLAVRRPDLASGYATCSTMRCFAHAVRVAAQLRRTGLLRRAGGGLGHLHAHFAHDPALVGLLVHHLTGVRFTFTAHARDLYQVPVPSLLPRIAAAAAVITCCQTNADYLTCVLPAGLAGRVHVIPHGLPLDRFSAAPAGDHDGPVRIVSVGRLVEKKGFADLLEACALVRAAGHEYTCDIYGGGPMAGQLERLRDRLGLAGVVVFCGERDQEGIAEALAGADVFALTPCVTDDGDRDGIPNVMVEAMACALPVVTTAAGGVLDLVRDGETGLVAPPHDVAAIAENLTALLTDPRRRRQLGAAGRAVVEEGFDIEVSARRLAALYADGGMPR
jgi:glycosyltransferase involved in cell wall biosynthesis